MKSTAARAKQVEIQEKRIWPRVNCDIDTECSSVLYKFPCRIIDISQYGLGVIVQGNLLIDDLLDFRDPLVMTKVIWSNGNRAGLKIIN